MDYTFNLLKNARQDIVNKMTEQEDRISGGVSRILEALLADDFSDFSNTEKEAYMVWEVYNDALLALYKADEKLAQAVEIEDGTNYTNK